MLLVTQTNLMPHDCAPGTHESAINTQGIMQYSRFMSIRSQDRYYTNVFTSSALFIGQSVLSIIASSHRI